MSESLFEDKIGRAVEPGLESAALAVRVGALPVTAIIPTLATWALLTLSWEDPRLGPEHFRPLVLTAPDGSPMIAAFTSPDRARAFAKPELHPFWAPGRMLASGAKSGAGIVINPGTEPSLPLLVPGLEAMLAADTRFVDQPPGSREADAA